MANIESVLASLDKDTLSKFMMGSEVEKNLIPTASLGLNMHLGGGIPTRHQTTVWGNESAGKSALMMQTVGLNQAAGRSCGLIDAENSFDREWAMRLGVDVDRFPVSPIATIGGATDVMIKWMNAGMDLIIVDSISALMPKSFYNEGEMKAFEKTAQVGQQAKELGQMCRMLQGENRSTAVVFISQVRMDLGNSFMPGMKPSGGKEVGHADSLRVKLFSSKSEKQAIMGDTTYGEQVIQEIVGRNVTWNIDKNKVNGKYGSGEYGLYTQGNFVGVDRAGELLDYGVKYGFVDKAGAWITVMGERLQGRPRAVEYVRNNPEVAEKLEAEIVGLYQSL